MTLLWFSQGCIQGQFAYGIDLQFGGCIHLGIPQAWLPIGHAVFCFLYWSLIDQVGSRYLQKNSNRIALTFSRWTYYGTSQTWLSFGHAVSRAYDLSSSLRVFDLITVTFFGWPLFEIHQACLCFVYVFLNAGTEPKSASWTHYGTPQT